MNESYDPHPPPELSPSSSISQQHTQIPEFNCVHLLQIILGDAPNTFPIDLT